VNTLLLNANWDLTLNTSGNIATAYDDAPVPANEREAYALAQDAASAIKTFQGECWYNTLLGVPYWVSILGQWPPITLMKAKFVSAALTVPDVASAVCYIASFTNREITGQVQITSVSGQLAAAGFGSTVTLIPPQSSGQPLGVP
jgi:hypothetical protein